MYLAPGLIVWYDVSNGKGTSYLVHGMKGACIGVAYNSSQRISKMKIGFSGRTGGEVGQSGIVGAGDFCFFLWKGNKNHQLRTGFCVHHRIVSAVKRVEFVSDMVSYIVLRGRWCNIIVRNVHSPN